MSNIKHIFLVVGILSAVVIWSISCGALQGNTEHTSMVITNPKSLGYVLQANGVSKKRSTAVIKLNSAQADWIVLDYSWDGTKQNKWTSDELKIIRSGKPGRRIISYLSIGEAESYRAYWKNSWSIRSKAPIFLKEENPSWKGNFKVEYWNDEWQKIIASYLDDIIEQGFDGIYLDIIDGFEYFEYDKKNDKWIDNRKNPKTKQSYRQDMIQFVIKLATYARRKNPNFIIIPQNGTQLLSNEAYRKAISAIGVEDIFTINNAKQPKTHQQYVVKFLNMFKKEKKPIFDIEYPTTLFYQEYAEKKAKQHDFILLITNRDLNKI